MSHLYNTGIAVVDSDPNGITTLQPESNLREAVHTDGVQRWKYVSSNPAGSKWVRIHEDCILTGVTVSLILTNPTTCTSNDGIIEITATPSTDLVYSIDGSNYQSSNKFYKLSSGFHRIFVKNSITGCVMQYSNQQFFTSGYTVPAIVETSSPGYTARDGANIVVADNGDLHLLGGWDGAGTLSDNHYKSTDNGVTWVQQPNAPFGKRHTFGTAKLGTEWFVFGQDFQGFGANENNSVWKTTNFTTWTQLNTSPPFGYNWVYGATSHNGFLYVMGGHTPGVSTNTTKVNEIWRSVDGLTWTSLGANLLPNGGGMLTGHVASYKNELYIVSPSNYDDDITKRNISNGVWKSSDDGLTWIAVGTMPTPLTHYGSLFVANDRLYFKSGFNPLTNGNVDKLYYTEDGNLWKEVINQSLGAGHAVSIAKVGTKIMQFAGYTPSKVTSITFGEGSYFDARLTCTDEILDIPTEYTCTTSDESILVRKANGNVVAKPSGSIKSKETYPLGDYSILPDDGIIVATGGSDLTLPSCTSGCTEKTIYRNACDNDIVTILPPASQLIDGLYLSKVMEVGRGVCTFKCVNGIWRVKNQYLEVDSSSASFSLLASTSAQVTVFSQDGLAYSVDWGDGTNSGLISNGVTASKTYASSFTGNIKIIKTCGVSNIYRIEFNAGNWNFNISATSQLKYLRELVIFSGSVVGNINSLPTSLTDLLIGGSNTTTGDIASLPSRMKYYSNAGSNTTSGKVENLPSKLQYFYNTGSNVTSGNIGLLPTTIIEYVNTGSNTTSGNVNELPLGITLFQNHGNNITSGNIGSLPSTLSFYNNRGNNTTFGSINTLPSVMTYYANTGSNTTTGDVDNLPNVMEVYINQGLNTVTGNIGNLPTALTYFDSQGFNTTFGDIGTLPSGVTFYQNSGNNSVSDYSGGGLNNDITFFLSAPASGGLSSTEVDNLLIELESTIPGIFTVILTGTNAAPTAASLTARNNLIAAGSTVVTN